MCGPPQSPGAPLANTSSQTRPDATAPPQRIGKRPLFTRSRVAPCVTMKKSWRHRAAAEQRRAAARTKTMLWGEVELMVMICMHAAKKFVLIAARRACRKAKAKQQQAAAARPPAVARARRPPAQKEKNARARMQVCALAHPLSSCSRLFRPPHPKKSERAKAPLPHALLKKTLSTSNPHLFTS